MYRVFAFWCFVMVLSVSQVDARSHRVAQIPNGGTNRCANCHVDPAGGGPRNAFGQAIENGFLSSAGAAGNVVWNATIAGRDSDGDGVTNGQELGDPDGDGTATSGIVVTNPGDPASFQATNKAPTFTAVSDKTVNEGVLLTFQVQASDPDNDPVTITASGLPTGATFSNGTFTWTPGFDQSGSYTVTFTASDGKTQTALAVKISVTNVTLPLVVSSVTPSETQFVLSAGDTIRLTVVASSPDRGGVTYSWAVNGQVQSENSGSFLATVSTGDVDDIFAVTVSDGVDTKVQTWVVSKVLKGDIDGNNVVDFTDFLSFVSSFGKGTGDTGFVAKADIDGSGRVDFTDFLVFANFFGRRK